MGAEPADNQNPDLPHASRFALGAKTTTAVPPWSEQAWLRSELEQVAAIDRPSASPGEREAAEWIVARLSELGAAARIAVSYTQQTLPTKA
jgi:hypothetical protein